ncbi:MAG: hypothetical protein U0231_16665 [Nitrospiraceae bacterium]
MSPSEEGGITLKMEQRFVEASYVEHIESQSLAGMSYIKVFFQPEYGIDSAQSELTSLAYSIIRLLPPGVYPPSVFKFGVSSLPIGYLSINSDTLGPKEIRTSPTLRYDNRLPRSLYVSFAHHWAVRSAKSRYLPRPTTIAGPRYFPSKWSRPSMPRRHYPLPATSRSRPLDDKVLQQPDRRGREDQRYPHQGRTAPYRCAISGRRRTAPPSNPPSSA